MKWIRRIFLALAAIGTTLLGFSAYSHQSEDWRPVSGAFPGSGLILKQPFSVRQSGSYQLEVWIPNLKGNGDYGTVQPVLDCDLLVVIERDSKSVVNEHILSLHHAGSFGFGGIENYASEKNWTLSRGGYVFLFESKRTPEVVTTQGGTAELTRYYHPVEWLLFYSFQRSAGLALGVFGFLGLIACEFKKI